jgi:hypothetical protein
MTGSRVSIGAQGMWLTVTVVRVTYWQARRAAAAYKKTVAMTCGHAPWAASDPDSDCGTPATESELPGGCHGTGEPSIRLQVRGRRVGITGYRDGPRRVDRDSGRMDAGRGWLGSHP